MKEYVKLLANPIYKNSRIEFDALLKDKIQDILELNLELFKQFNQNIEFKDKIANTMFNMVCNDF